MIKVNNKKAIRHVADISFKAEKSRNIFAIIAIILTTILFSGLFTIGANLLSSMEESTMRQVGGNAHAGFKYLDEEKYNKLKTHPLIKEISYSVLLGFAENKELNKRPTEIRYVNDEKQAAWMFSMPAVGRLPEKSNELATDTLVLKALNIEPKLGELVNITHSINNDTYDETFELVGFWEGDIISSTSMIWLSKDYVESILNNYNPADLKNGVGNIFADVMLKNKNSADNKMRQIIIDSGYSENDIQFGVNWAYASSMKMDDNTMLGIAAVLLIIVFCGYLIISNIFLISVSNDTKFYGLLKTIGTTGKQLKTLIRRQAFLMCLIGVPIGSALGIFTGAALTPVILSNFNVNVINVKFNPLVFDLTALFSAVTVWISIQKALKTAAKVSPIEALKTNGGIMKKAIFVVVSISLSLLSLNIAYSMANSFDMDKYLSGMITHDFVMGDVSCFNVYLDYAEQDTLSDDFISKINAMEGIENSGAVYFHEQNMPLLGYWDDMPEIAKGLDMQTIWYDEIVKGVKNDKGYSHIYGLDNAIWNDVTILEGTLDIEKLKTGKYVVVAPYDTEGQVLLYHPRDTIEFFKDDGSTISMEVLAVGSLPYSLGIKHSHPVEADFLMPSDVFSNKIKNKAPMIFTCDVKDENRDSVDEFLQSWCEQNPDMQYKSKASYVEEYKSTQRMFKSVGVVVSALLGLIGAANFANTVITSVMVRKRELAILESVGMTKMQQNKMIMAEGLLYIVFSLVFTLTLGTALSIAVLNSTFGTDGYFSTRYTVAPSLIVSPVYIIFSIIIPLLVLHYVNKRSVVDRLREFYL